MTTRRRRPRRRAQASASARGYGHAHQKMRALWRPVVDGGMAFCHAVACKEGDRWIRPGTPWHLGHTPDRTAWTGPEHASCNTSEGATRGNRDRAMGAGLTVDRAKAARQSRAW